MRLEVCGCVLAAVGCDFDVCFHLEPDLQGFKTDQQLTSKDKSFHLLVANGQAVNTDYVTTTVPIRSLVSC